MIPSESKTALDGFLRNTTAVGPFCNRERFTVDQKKPIGSRVSGLLYLCRPSAITRLVVATVILAINRHSIRWMSHIGKEILKVSPAFAHHDSAAAISKIVVIVWILTAGAHRLPYVIHATGMQTVRSTSITTSARALASAGNSCALLERATQYRFSYTAVTLTLPPHRSEPAWCDMVSVPLNNYELTETETDVLMSALGRLTSAGLEAIPNSDSIMVMHG